MRRTVRALDTHYNGYKFRSRLEARWAVFMDCAGVKYRYEFQGYGLGDLGGYLPDFWLPELESWLEIKPIPPSRSEFRKAEALADGMARPVFILFGEPNIPDSDEWPRPSLPEGAWPEPFAFRVEDGVMDHPYLWCECYRCGMVGIEYEGRGTLIPCGCSQGDKYYAFDTPKLCAAYLEARRERFEAA